MSRFATLCVTTTMVRPSWARSRIISMTDLSSPGSRPEVGSSRKSSDGLVRSSSATLARLRWPPDSRPMARSACADRPSSSRTSSHRGDSGSAALVSPGIAAARVPEARRGQLRVQDVGLGDQADAVPQLRVFRVQVAVAYWTVPSVAGRVPVTAPSSVDLPAPLARSRRPGTLGDREAHVVEQDLALRGPYGEVLGDQRDVAGVDDSLSSPTRRKVARPIPTMSISCSTAEVTRRPLTNVPVMAAEIDHFVVVAAGLRDSRGNGRRSGRARRRRCPARGRSAACGSDLDDGGQLRETPVCMFIAGGTDRPTQHRSPCCPAGRRSRPRYPPAGPSRPLTKVPLRFPGPRRAAVHRSGLRGPVAARTRVRRPPGCRRPDRCPTYEAHRAAARCTMPPSPWSARRVQPGPSMRRSPRPS